MSLIENIRARAMEAGKHIVLAEGTEKRTVKAAEILTKEKIAHISLVGNVEEVQKVAAEVGADLTGVDIVDPAASEWYDDFSETYCKLREKKGMTIEKARETMLKPLYFGTMMVYKDICDGMVAGALNTTGDVLRPAFEIIKTKPGISTVSGAFLMLTPTKQFGEDGLLVFADCAVNPTLTAEQMAEVAWCTAQTAKDIAGIDEPKIAMLSFSTKGSAKHELVDKVSEATKIAQEKYQELLVDGELQLDAAIVPSVGEFKAPGSPVAGHANVLVFPGLETGNACYKAVQRFSGAEAIGPVLQGMNKPVNDLSRGCSIDDIVNTVAMVCCQK
ncbi:MAG: phosphate acetyltransferase [Firmicutes bacterium]|nr:phosphate acetyltransferase [Bacillota bacterium]